MGQRLIQKTNEFSNNFCMVCLFVAILTVLCSWTDLNEQCAHTHHIINYKIKTGRVPIAYR